MLTFPSDRLIGDRNDMLDEEDCESRFEFQQVSSTIVDVLDSKSDEELLMSVKQHQEESAKGSFSSDRLPKFKEVCSYTMVLTNTNIIDEVQFAGNCFFYFISI